MQQQQQVKVPLADPVEQRWEESAGKYLHKKFKKIAAVESSEPTPPAPPPPVASAPTSAVASAPADPAAHNSGAPLNHSVLSMLSSPQRAQPGSVIQHQQLRPPVPMPTDLSSKRLPAPPQQQQQQSQHLQISTQPKSDVLVCPLCRAAVSARDSDRHIRAHCSLASAARPYRCDACRFAFRLSSSLERHIRFVANIFNVFDFWKKTYFLICFSGLEVMLSGWRRDRRATLWTSLPSWGRQSGTRWILRSNRRRQYP